MKEQSRREKELVREMKSQEENNKLILMGMKKKLDTLKKCMNICFERFKKIKSEKVPQNVHYKVDLKGFDSFSSHLVSLDQTRGGQHNAFDQTVGGQRVLRFIRGKKKN